MVTGAQIKSGRVLLGWTAKILAQRAHVGLSTVLRFERSHESPRGNATCIKRIEQALSLNGIAFVTDADGGVGVLLRPHALPTERAQRASESVQPGE